jgi:hypothetical protein
MRTALTLLAEVQTAPLTSPAAWSLLDDIQIASPCSARWEDMTGDDRSRHCRACDKMVYDLLSLSAAQAVALIREKEGALCVRLFRRADGKVLTADCPEGLKARLDKFRPAALPRVITPRWLLFLFVCCFFGWLFHRVVCPPPVLGAINPSCLPNFPPGRAPEIDPPQADLPPPQEEK